MNYELKPLWSVILDIYGEFRKICERHNLRFCAIGGTALGAVRHKGFIPWDDDFDLMMPNEDYEKFLEFGFAGLPDHYKIVTGCNIDNPVMPFGKVMETRPEVVESLERAIGYKMPQGVYIDIFPYVGMPERESAIDRLKGKLLRIREYGIVEREYVTAASRMMRILGKMTLWVPGPRTVRETACLKRMWGRRIPFDAAAKVNVYNWMDCTFCDINGRFPRAGYPREWFNSFQLVPFEGTTIPLANGTHEWLSMFYGDYMKLPPEEKRILKHGSEKVSPYRLGPTDLTARP